MVSLLDFYIVSIKLQTPAPEWLRFVAKVKVAVESRAHKLIPFMRPLDGTNLRSERGQMSEICIDTTVAVVRLLDVASLVVFTPYRTLQDRWR